MNLVLGVLIISIGALGLVAIVTYNSLDKSLNTISDSPPENILGIPGAYASDIMVQFFGILSVIGFNLVPYPAAKIIASNFSSSTF